MEKRKLIEKMLMSGKTYTEIQDRLGVSPVTISEVKRTLENEVIDIENVGEQFTTQGDSIVQQTSTGKISVIDYMVNNLAPAIFDQLDFEDFPEHHQPALKFYFLIQFLGGNTGLITQHHVMALYYRLLERYSRKEDEGEIRKAIWSEIFYMSYITLMWDMKIEPSEASEEYR